MKTNFFLFSEISIAHENEIFGFLAVFMRIGQTHPVFDSKLPEDHNSTITKEQMSLTIWIPTDGEYVRRLMLEHDWEKVMHQLIGSVIRYTGECDRNCMYYDKNQRKGCNRCCGLVWFERMIVLPHFTSRSVLWIRRSSMDSVMPAHYYSRQADKFANQQDHRRMLGLYREGLQTEAGKVLNNYNIYGNILLIILGMTFDMEPEFTVWDNMLIDWTDVHNCRQRYVYGKPSLGALKRTRAGSTAQLLIDDVSLRKLQKTTKNKDFDKEVTKITSLQTFYEKLYEDVRRRIRSGENEYKIDLANVRIRD
jgi:hypothetical protein